MTDLTPTTGGAAAGTRKSSAKPARSRSREFALQALYQHIVGRNEASDIDVFTRDLSGFHKADSARLHRTSDSPGCLDRPQTGPQLCRNLAGGTRRHVDRCV
jgi:N utilization substance protein B